MNTPADTLRALISSGLTEQRIADQLAEQGVRITQPTINRIKRGVIRRPSFDVGAALLRLHRELADQPRRDLADVPKRRRRG